MAEVYLNANATAARHRETRAAVRRENRMVYGRARSNLAQANTTQRISQKGHYYPATVVTQEHDIDCFTLLIATNAMALEFGHKPSGAFEDTDTKPPAPTYILIRAALGGHTIY